MLKRLLALLTCFALVLPAAAQTVVPNPVTIGVPNIVKGTASFAGTSYGQFKSIGGLITVPTGLPAGTLVSCLCDFLVSFVNSNITSSQSLIFIWFDSNPTSSTFTDGQTVSLATVDIPKVATMVNSANGTNAQAGLLYWTPSQANRVAVDASGNLYFALYNANGSAFTFTAAGTIYWRYSRAQ